MKLVFNVCALFAFLAMGGCASTLPANGRQQALAGMPQNSFVYHMRVSINRSARGLHEATVTTQAAGAVLARARHAQERLEFLAPNGSTIVYLDKVPVITPGQFDGRFVVDLPPELPRGLYTVRTTLLIDGTVRAFRAGSISVGMR